MFDNIKKKIAKKFHKSDTPPKQFVPLDIRLGSHVTIKTNVPVIYDSLCNKPESIESVIAIGTYVISTSKVFKFYFSDDKYLQIICNTSDNEIEECRLFNVYETVLPSTSKGWGEWIASREGKIGLFNFDVADREFVRMESWADPEEDWVRPIVMQEAITKLIPHNKEQPKEFLHKEHAMMGYGRWLNEEHEVAEYVIVSSEELTNNVNETLVSKVTISTGIDVMPDDIEVF